MEQSKRRVCAYAVVAIMAAVGLSACHDSAPDSAVAGPSVGQPGPQVTPRPIPTETNPEPTGGEPTAGPTSAPTSAPTRTPVPVPSPSVTHPPLQTEVIWTADRAKKEVIGAEAGTGRVLARVSLPSEPTALLSEGGRLWVGAVGAVYKVDVTSGRIEKSIPLEGSAQSLLLDRESLWVADLRGSGPWGGKTPELIRVDQESGEVVAEIPLGDIADYFGGMSADENGLWVLMNNHFALYRIDPQTGRSVLVSMPGLRGYGHGSILAGGQTLRVFDQYLGKLFSFNISPNHSLKVDGAPVALDRTVEPEFFETPRALVFRNRAKSELIFVEKDGRGMPREMPISGDPRAMALEAGDLYVATDGPDGRSAVLVIDLGETPEIVGNIQSDAADAIAISTPRGIVIP